MVPPSFADSEVPVVDAIDDFSIEKEGIKAAAAIVINWLAADRIYPLGIQKAVGETRSQ